MPPFSHDDAATGDEIAALWRQSLQGTRYSAKEPDAAIWKDVTAALAVPAERSEPPDMLPEATVWEMIAAHLDAVRRSLPEPPVQYKVSDRRFADAVRIVRRCAAERYSNPVLPRDDRDILIGAVITAAELELLSDPHTARGLGPEEAATLAEYGEPDRLERWARLKAQRTDPLWLPKAERERQAAAEAQRLADEQFEIWRRDPPTWWQRWQDYSQEQPWLQSTELARSGTALGDKEPRAYTRRSLAWEPLAHICWLIAEVLARTLSRPAGTRPNSPTVKFAAALATRFGCHPVTPSQLSRRLRTHWLPRTAARQKKAP